MAKVVPPRWQSDMDALVKEYLTAQGVDADKLFNAATGYTVERSLDALPVLVFRIPVWSDLLHGGVVRPAVVQPYLVGESGPELTRKEE
jgi:hypothetical protein